MGSLKKKKTQSWLLKWISNFLLGDKTVLHMIISGGGINLRETAMNSLPQRFPCNCHSSFCLFQVFAVKSPGMLYH